jgi:hypothetical protein
MVLAVGLRLALVEESTMYGYGVLALLLMWGVSCAVTGTVQPLALARGNNKKMSASQLQLLIFTAVTLFAYVSIAVGRLLGPGTHVSLPGIPYNLLLLMGFSVATTTSSKGIAVSYLEKGLVSAKDDSTLTANREGETELTKVQMITWMIVTAAIYLVQVQRFIESGEYLTAADTALPDVDGALMVLMGVSQGAYVGGKLVSKAAGPMIESVLPQATKFGGVVSVLGLGFGATQDPGDSVVLKSAAGEERDLDPKLVAEWTDTRIRITTVQDLVGKWTLVVRAKGVRSRPSDTFGVTSS